MTQTITRALTARIDDVSDGERSVVARISTGDVDRYQSVINPAGGDLAGFRKNPIVLWEHGQDRARGSLPVGRALWIKLDRANRALVAKTQFAKDDFSDGLFRLYQEDWFRVFEIPVLPSFRSG